MYRNILIAAVAISFATSCKKQLDISNTNQPTPQSAATERGIISLAQGSIYYNGFYSLKYTDGVYGRFWSGTMGFHSLMGDEVGAEAANAFLNQIGLPNKITLDNGTVLTNPSSLNTQYALLRTINTNAQSGSNTTYYEWAYMYNMIVAANNVLALADQVAFSGNAASKKATIQAWAYWWKGYAYAHIGSIYYAGIIQNEIEAKTNGNYVTKEAIIAESNSQFDKAATAIDAANTASATDFTTTLTGLIPTYLQLGRGRVLTPAMWKRNINTMKARNLLVNTTVAALTTTQLSSILTLTNDGIQSGDYIFTGRTDANGDFIGGTVADKVQSTASATNTYKLSERWVQEFKTGDLRRTNNVRALTTTGIFNADRGTSFNTRYTLYNGGNGVTGTITYTNTTAGAFEMTLAGTYEENELMKAEALILSGTQAQIDQGVLSINAVRTFQGAGLTALAAGMTKAAAYEELRRERRIALAFKGLAFYDARRLEITDPAKSRTGCVVIAFNGAVNTNATINYGFLDYWDVPDNELAYNPAVAGSAAIKNPK